MTEPSTLLAGEIGKPHGLNGEVYVVVISDDPRRFEPGSRLFHESGRTLEVESARRHRDRLLVKFAGIDDRPHAEELRGALHVPSDDLRSLEAGEYWEHDIVGCEVATVGGGVVGRVEGLIPGGAQDLLAVSTDHGERLVPFVSEFVVKVDVANRRIELDPPEGLFE